MNITVEIQLLLLAIGLYIYDSILLLYPNEAILSAAYNNKWQIKFGYKNTNINGKELFVQNLLLPQRPIFKLFWNYEGKSEEQKIQIDWKIHQEQFKILSFPILMIAIAQLIIFPYVIFFYLTDISIIISLIFLYASIIISLLLVYKKINILKISKRKFYLICFECLICPPIAINLARKISLAIPESKEDLLNLSKRILEEHEWNITKKHFITKIEDELQISDENTERYIKMIANRNHLLVTKSI
jgi:hypothetical protein